MSGVKPHKKTCFSLPANFLNLTENLKKIKIKIQSQILQKRFSNSHLR